MKNLIYLILFLPIIMFSQVGVNTLTPNAMLDVQSTEHGVLIPRVQLASTTDVTTVVNPQGGALQTSTLVYNIAANGTPPLNVETGFYYWNGVFWVLIDGNYNWRINGNFNITPPAVPATYGTSLIGTTENFIGTTNAFDFAIGTDRIERMRVKSISGFVGIGTTNPTTPFEVVSYGINEFRLSSRGAFGTSRLSMISDKELSNEWRPAYIESADNGAFTGRMDFYTNGTGIINRFGSLRAMSITNGNVGIATTNPNLARFHVDGMVGNTTAVFRGNSNSSLGVSIAADWPGIFFNSYYNGGIRSMAGSGYASIINTDQLSGGLVFQTTNAVNPASGTIMANLPTRMTITGNGNVGIGISPTQKLHVFDNSDINKSAIFGEATQSTTGTDHLNIGVNGVGNGIGVWGNGIGVLGRSDVNNTWNATGVYAHLGTANPTVEPFISKNNALYANGNGIGNAATFVGGNVGIGLDPTNDPLNLLHIYSFTSGAVRIVDGTQGANRVLTSDATGVATWRDSALTGVTGTAGFGGITIPTSQTTGFLNTGKSITLPPGRWVVNVTMLMSVYQTPATPPSPNNSSFWLRTCFADPTTLGTLTRTMDTVGSYYVSGNLPGTSMFSILTGSIIINNTSGSNRTYTYLAGEVLSYNTTISLRAFTGWGEDSIVAYRIN